MENAAGVLSAEWGLDLQDLPAPPLLHQATFHRLLQVTKEGKCNLDTLQFQVSQKTCPSRSNAAFPPCHGSLTNPTFGLESIEGKRFFHWKCGDWGILFVSFFLFLIKDSEHYYFTEKLRVLQVFPR